MRVRIRVGRIRLEKIKQKNGDQKSKLLHGSFMENGLEVRSLPSVRVTVAMNARGDCRHGSQLSRSDGIRLHRSTSLFMEVKICDSNPYWTQHWVSMKFEMTKSMKTTEEVFRTSSVEVKCRYTTTTMEAPVIPWTTLASPHGTVLWKLHEAKVRFRFPKSTRLPWK